MKVNDTRKEALMRIVVLIVSGLILYLWMYVVGILAIINFLIQIFADRRSRDIADFCEYWNTESYRFYRYITAVSNERPFPFTTVQKMGKFK